MTQDNMNKAKGNGSIVNWEGSNQNRAPLYGRPAIPHASWIMDNFHIETVKRLSVMYRFVCDSCDVKGTWQTTEFKVKQMGLRHRNTHKNLSWEDEIGPEMLICDLYDCENLFVPSRVTQKFCAILHTVLYHFRITNYIPAPRPLKHCKFDQCNNFFTGPKHRLYCSKNCSARYRCRKKQKYENSK